MAALPSNRNSYHLEPAVDAESRLYVEEPRAWHNPRLDLWAKAMAEMEAVSAVLDRIAKDTAAAAGYTIYTGIVVVADHPENLAAMPWRIVWMEACD